MSAITTATDNADDNDDCSWDDDGGDSDVDDEETIGRSGKSPGH